MREWNPYEALAHQCGIISYESVCIIVYFAGQEEGFGWSPHCLFLYKKLKSGNLLVKFLKTSTKIETWFYLHSITNNSWRKQLEFNTAYIICITYVFVGFLIFTQFWYISIKSVTASVLVRPLAFNTWQGLMLKLEWFNFYWTERTCFGEFQLWQSMLIVTHLVGEILG